MRVNSGLTILEILVVIVIIGTMTALSIPLLSQSKKNTTLINSTTEIADMFKLAKNLAFTKDKNYTLMADLSADTICTQDNDTGQVYGKIWRAPNTINLYTSTKTTGKEAYTFSPRGTTSASPKLYVEAAHGECHTITVYPLSTGKINHYTYKKT